MGSPSLHWLDIGWWSFGHSIVVLLFHVLFSFLPTQFLLLLPNFVPFCSLLKLRPSAYGCSYGKWHGLVGLIGLSKSFSYCFFISSCWAGPLGLFQGLFSFLLKRAISLWLTLPYYPCVIVFYFLFFMGISSLWALGAWPHYFCFYSLDCPFFLLTWFELFCHWAFVIKKWY